MKQNTGFYPWVQVDTGPSAAVGQAGAVLLTDTIRVAGLDVALAQALGPWRKPTAVHHPAKIVCDLAVALAVGGDCLADVAVIRSEPGLFGPVASDATVSRLVDTLAGDVAAALVAIDMARAAARATVWRLAGDQAPRHRRGPPVDHRHRRDAGHVAFGQGTGQADLQEGLWVPSVVRIRGPRC